MATRLPRTVAVSLVIVFAGCLALSAAARTNDPLLRRGNQLFTQGEYQEAREVLEQAFRAHPGPDTLRSLAHCLVKVRWYPDALVRFKEYLKRYPQARDRTKIEQIIQHLEVAVRTRLIVRTRPMGATVYLDAEAAGAVGTTPFTAMVEPGQHVIILNKDGFRTIARAVRIAPKQTVEIRIPLEVDLRVNSSPSGASVHIGRQDATARGRTPLASGIPLGRQTVHVKLPGFLTFSKILTVRPHQRIVIDAILEKAISIRSIPTGAWVEVGGRRLPGKTPLEVPLPAGRHSIRLGLPGFTSFHRQVQVDGATPGSITGRLSGDGLLSLDSDPPGATASVRGITLGKTPLIRVGVPLGEHELTLKHPHRSTWDDTVLFRKGTHVSARVKLGRPSWPAWVLLGVAGLAAIIGTASGIAAIDQTNRTNSMLVEERDAAGRPTGRLAVGACSASGQPIFANMWDAERDTDANDACGLGMQHLATGFLTAAGASALGALIYRLVFGRSSASIASAPAPPRH